MVRLPEGLSVSAERTARDVARWPTSAARTDSAAGRRWAAVSAGSRLAAARADRRRRRHRQRRRLRLRGSWGVNLPTVAQRCWRAVRWLGPAATPHEQRSANAVITSRTQRQGSRAPTGRDSLAPCSSSGEGHRTAAGCWSERHWFIRSCAVSMDSMLAPNPLNRRHRGHVIAGCHGRRSRTRANCEGSTVSSRWARYGAGSRRTHRAARSAGRRPGPPPLDAAATTPSYTVTAALPGSHRPRAGTARMPPR